MTWDEPDEVMCHNLSKIVKETNAKVVLSSTWRLKPDLARRIQCTLQKWDVKVMAFTPNFESKPKHNTRADEIIEFIYTYRKKVDRWIAIDDLPLTKMDAEFRDHSRCGGMRISKDHFVMTNDAEGLTKELADEAIRKLNIPPPPPG